MRLIPQQVLDRPEQVQGRLPVIFFHRLANVLDVLREALIPCAPFSRKRLCVGLDVGIQNLLFPQRIVPKRTPPHRQNRNQQHNEKQDCQHIFFMTLRPLQQGVFAPAQSVLPFHLCNPPRLRAAILPLEFVCSAAVPAVAYESSCLKKLLAASCQ